MATIVGDILQARINLQVDATAASMGLWYQVVSIPGTDENPCKELANEVLALVPNLLIPLSEQAGVISVYCTGKTGQRPSPVLQNSPVNPGVFAGPSLPANNAAVIRLHQSEDSATHDGRLFMPGIAEGATITNLMTFAGYVASIKTWADSLLVIIATQFTYRLMIAGTEINPAPPPIFLPKYRVVTSTSVSPIIYSQRRRTTKTLGSGYELFQGA